MQRGKRANACLFLFLTNKKRETEINLCLSPDMHFCMVLMIKHILIEEVQYLYTTVPHCESRRLRIEFYRPCVAVDRLFPMIASAESISTDVKRLIFQYIFLLCNQFIKQLYCLLHLICFQKPFRSINILCPYHASKIPKS